MNPEWRRMLNHFHITDEHWPFGGVKDWRSVLHIWIDENVNDKQEQRAMHGAVSKW